MGLVKFLYDLKQIPQELPTRGSLYHILWLVFVVVGCVVLCAAFANCKDKTFRTIIILMWIWMFVFEIYKQVFFNAIMVDGEIVFRYSWGGFPFQLCSTPLYILPLLGFLPDGKLRDAAAAYTMTYALVGGAAVLIHPMTVFSTSVVVNIHSMSHHCIQVLTGVFTAAWYRNRLTGRFFLRGFSLFTVIYAIAMLLNTVFRNFLIRIGQLTPEANFNMFFVSPYMKVHSPFPDWVIGSFSPWQIVGIYYAGMGLISGVLILLISVIFCKDKSQRKISALKIRHRY